MPEASIFLCAVALAASIICRITSQFGLRARAYVIDRVNTVITGVKILRGKPVFMFSGGAFIKTGNEAGKGVPRHSEKRLPAAFLIFAIAAFFSFATPFAPVGHWAETAEARAAQITPQESRAQNGFSLAAAGDNTPQNAAPAPRQEQAPVAPDSDRPAWVERYFRGSFLGSFFLGYPYSGVGLPDIVVMVIAGLLALRLIFSKIMRGRRGAYPKPREANSRASMQRFDTSWSERNKSGYRAQAEDDFVEMSEPRPMGSSRKALSTANSAADIGQQTALTEGRGRAAEAAYTEASSQHPGMRENPHVVEQEAGVDVYLGQWASIAAGVALPPGFDADYFLEWGRSIYATLQYAWADRQVDALAPYVSREMFNVLKAQAAKDPYPVQVDIKYVHSRLTDIRHNDNWAQVSIGFTVSMSSGLEGRPVEIRETWRFVCGGDDGAWRVEAIEQA